MISQPSTLKAIIIGSRPPTLLLGISPVLLGTALGYRVGDGSFNGLTFALAMIAVVLMQSAANLINDVKDAETGVDTEHRIGPTRVVAAGLLSKEIATWTYRIMLAAALSIGVALIGYGGGELFLLALASCLGAYLYTGGPFPLSHYALGELAALIFFGPVAILGSAYLQSLVWSFDKIIVALGPGFLAASVMAINNLRDRETDRYSSKITLALISPRWLGHQLPWIFILSSLFCLLSFAELHQHRMPGFIIFIILWLTAFIFIKPLIREKSVRLNEALKKTSGFVVLYCLLFSYLVLL